MWRDDDDDNDDDSDCGSEGWEVTQWQRLRISECHQGRRLMLAEGEKSRSAGKFARF